MNRPRFVLLCLGLFAAGAPAVPADVPRVLPAGAQPNDARLGPLRDLNGYFPFTPPASREAWAERAEQVRRRVLVAAGLWPMPTKTPLNAVIHGRIDRGEYAVEKVYFESYPGHFVTGNLYRPAKRNGRAPGVLCPHGHWRNGRFYDAGETALRQQIVQGAERFDPAGRFPLQARCVQLARMGCIVFHYDMVGYADSRQLAHRPGSRPHMNTLENWGLFSPRAELWLQTIYGLQTYNSIRALDFLLSLPDVDPKRIGVTGASGGGTQTFMLCAVDPRPTVAVPAVMVSTAMQGGCVCENASYLRIGTGNVEIAGLFAPKPLGLLAANDWTVEMATKGFPELKQLYELLGAPDRVALWPLTQFPHNYNYVSRAKMYSWMNRRLRLGWKEPIVEQDFQPLTRDEMTVWDERHPAPPGGEEHERALLRWMTEDARRRMARLTPRDPGSLDRFRRVVGGGVDVLIGRRLSDVGEPAAKAAGRAARGDYVLERLLLRCERFGEEVPALLLTPSQGETNQLVVWISSEGKRMIVDRQGDLRPSVRRLLDGGAAVLALDLFGQGEFTSDGAAWTRQRLATGRDAWKTYAGYTYGYNPPLFAQRAHDILTAIAWGRRRFGKDAVSLAAPDGAGRWAAAALAQAPGAVRRAALDTGGFRFTEVNALDHADFLPGAAKYLDLPGMLALAAPCPLWLAGEGDSPPPLVAAAYRAAGAEPPAAAGPGDAEDRCLQAAAWLLQP